MKSVLITSSILIVLIAALRPLLRGKISPRVQYALWLAVALRLLIPVNVVTSAYSALALLDRAGEPRQMVESIGQATVPVPAMSYEDAYLQALREYQQDKTVTTSFTDLEEVERRAQELQAKEPTLAELAAKYARPVWLGGAAVMGLWFLLVNFRLRRKLKYALPVEADCPLPVRVTPELPSPCLCGVFRPAVYVAPAALESPGRLRHVLAHELAHYRHGDHWWALVRCLCLCLYWFDPLVWWAAALSRQDCELACDEGAIRALGEGERIPYGRTLVAMIAAGRNPLLQTATTMTGGKRRVRERVKLIARKPQTMIAAALALALILGLTVGFTFTGAPEEDSPGPDPTASLAPDGERPALDTLRERLEDIPEEITGVKTAYLAEQPQETVLAAYHLDILTDQSWEGWLLTVLQWDQVSFENWLYSIETGNFYVFAKDDNYYYAFMRATDVRYSMEDAERYQEALQAVWDFAQRQVLDTQGVERFDADELRSREYLLEGKTYTDVAYWPYKAVNGSTDAVWIYRMVQPAKQGPGGVWIPERWEVYDSEHGVDLTPQHIKPDTRGLTVAEYGEQLQAEADAGEAGWATDPIQALRRYEEETGSQTDIPLDSFTNLSGYIESVRETRQPSRAQLAVQAAADRILAAPSVTLSLAPAGTSRVYPYPADPSEEFYAYCLRDLSTMFRWEEAPYSTSVGSDSLRVYSDDGSASLFFSEGSYLVLAEVDGETSCYKGQYLYGGEAGYTPFDYLRNWFDDLEFRTLASTVVPDRGQGHEETAREWVEGHEGAMEKVSPGSPYACTYVSVKNVKADLPDGMTGEELDAFARSRGLSGEDFGKTWFGFSYELVFVPANEQARNNLIAGNTYDYDGGDAPEGAMTYSRLGIMRLTSGGWNCDEIGTGW